MTLLTPAERKDRLQRAQRELAGAASALQHGRNATYERKTKVVAALLLPLVVEVESWEKGREDVRYAEQKRGLVMR